MRCFLAIALVACTHAGSAELSLVYPDHTAKVGRHYRSLEIAVAGSL